MTDNKKGDGAEKSNALTKSTVNRPLKIRTAGSLPATRMAATQPTEAKLPRAVIIYAGAASFFAVLALFYLIKGLFITGLIMFMPTACLAGFAWYYLKASGVRF